MKKLIAFIGGLCLFLILINPVQALTPQERLMIRNMIFDISWHPNNDGSGSGLDADLLDGIDSTQYLRNDQDGTLIGNLTIDGESYFSGNVGIGTTGPIGKFEVSNSSTNNATRIMQLGSLANDKYGLLVYGSAANTGIGGAGTSALFRVHDDSENSTVPVAGFRGDGTGDLLQLLDGGNADSNKVLVVKDGGNVGIGTTSPDEKLHIEGDVKINGDIVSDGEICIGSGC